MNSIKPDPKMQLPAASRTQAAVPASSLEKNFLNSSAADSVESPALDRANTGNHKERKTSFPYQISSHLKGFTNDADLASPALTGAHNLPPVSEGGFIRIDTIDSWDGTPDHLEHLKAKTKAHIMKLASEGLITPELQDASKAKWKKLANDTFGFNTFNMTSPKWMKK